MPVSYADRGPALALHAVTGGNSMAGTTLLTTPILPFGVEVAFDLRSPLDTTMTEKLQKLRAQHHLLLFRNQMLSLERQMEVISHLGPVLQSEGDGYGYVSNKDPRGILGNTELDFHSDLDFSPIGSYYLISLLAIRVPDGKTSTFFANAKRAYESLPTDVKERIDEMQAIDVWIKDPTIRNRLKELPEHAPQLKHPLVRLLPISGDRAIYASRTGTSDIVGLAESESDRLLETLFAYLYDPANVYEHKWMTGDLLIWDNRALQHRRGQVSADSERTLQRVVSAEPGSGFYAQFPQFTLEQYRASAKQ
jgi:taurine dioxygenase